MGIDHGLGGKDNKKSQQKREKRAVKNKSIAMKAMTGGKKKEVLFNENARIEWLTGFGKRKQERRKFGLAMEVIKKQKIHKEGVKEQRNAIKEAKILDDHVKMGHSDDEVEKEDDEQSESEEVEELQNKNTVQIFGDNSTISMFGSTVSVAIDTSIADDSAFGENIDQDVGARRNNGRNGLVSGAQKKPELTKLEKAMKKVKSQLGSGRKKKHKDTSFEGGKKSLAIKSKMESSKLLFKAMGKGGLGNTANAYKGSKTKRGGGGAVQRSQKRK
jgi:ribosomal RNA-processing protein 17